MHRASRRANAAGRSTANRDKIIATLRIVALSPAVAPTSKLSRLQMIAVCLLSLLGLLPFLQYRAHFAGLFWFGDEFDLIDQIDQIGLSKWMWTAFAENFLPLFKFAWGGLVFATGGSYFAMLWVVWLTHALNVGLLSLWMFRSGFGFFATALAAAVFGLSATNIETLTWTVQWSAMLAVTFFLAAMLAFGAVREQRGRDIFFGALGLILWSTASAWSFSRGVLTGAVLAVLCFWSGPTTMTTGWRRFVLPVLCLLPSLATAGLIFALAPSNHHEVFTDSAQRIRAVSFAVWYFAHNPLVASFNISPVSWSTVAIFGGIKLILIALGLFFSTAPQKRLLFALLLLDLGNTVLLGIGRSGGDLVLAMSSRYQYSSLLSTLPFIGAAGAGLLSLIPSRAYVRSTAAALVLFAAAWRAYSHWSSDLPGWVDSRGLSGRRLLLSDTPLPKENAVPGIFFMENAKAKRLVERYHLH